MATKRAWSDLAIPPGEFLAETLEEMSITQAALARQMDRPAQAINEIVHGKKEVTPETALQLERVLGVPAHIWIRLEADYQLTKARLEAAGPRRVGAGAVRESFARYLPAPAGPVTRTFKGAHTFAKKKRSVKLS